MLLSQVLCPACCTGGLSVLVLVGLAQLFLHTAIGLIYIYIYTHVFIYIYICVYICIYI